MSATQSLPAAQPIVAGSPPLGRRLGAVRIIASLMAASAVGFGLFTIVFGLVNPAQEPHAFHNAMVASLLLLVSAPPSIAIALAPEQSVRPLVILTATAIAGLATMALALTLDPFTLPVAGIVVVLWALLPERRGAFQAGRPSLIGLLLVTAAALPLLAYAMGQAELQRVDHASEHAAFFHWVESSFLAAAVLLLGLLAASRPAAYRMAAWCAGAALTVLGAASIGLGSYASAFGAPWAAAAVIGGVAFIGVIEWEARRSSV